MRKGKPVCSTNKWRRRPGREIAESDRVGEADRPIELAGDPGDHFADPQVRHIRLRISGEARNERAAELGEGAVIALVRAIGGGDRAPEIAEALGRDGGKLPLREEIAGDGAPQSAFRLDKDPWR